jgi:hypothetical protein
MTQPAKPHTPRSVPLDPGSPGGTERTHFEARQETAQGIKARAEAQPPFFASGWRMLQSSGGKLTRQNPG